MYNFMSMTDVSRLFYVGSAVVMWMLGLTGKKERKKAKKNKRKE